MQRTSALSSIFYLVRIYSYKDAIFTGYHEVVSATTNDSQEVVVVNSWKRNRKCCRFVEDNTVLSPPRYKRIVDTIVDLPGQRQRDCN